MTASVIVFRGSKTGSAPQHWTDRDLAEFHRIASALEHAGMHIDCEEGVTDEGDPWYVICDSFTNEILIHYARIGSKYISEVVCLGFRLEGTSLPKLECEDSVPTRFGHFLHARKFFGVSSNVR